MMITPDAVTGKNTTTFHGIVDNHTQVNQDELNLSYVIPVGIVLSSMILCTATGNLLVVTAVIRERSLHTLANRLVASLAITDLMVGVLVLPLAAASVIAQKWPFGQAVCDFFITMDVLLCTNSILHLVAIAIDRYWTVTDITYTRGNKKHRYFFPVMVSMTWFLSAAVCLPPFFGWRTKKEKIDSRCVISQDKGYTIYSTLTAFYVPLLVIIIIYTKIFQVVRERVRRKQFSRKNELSQKSQKTLLDESKPQSPSEISSFKHGDGTTQFDFETRHDSNESSETANGSIATPTHQTEVKQSANGITKTVLKRINSIKESRSPRRNSINGKKRLAQKRERKALKTLLMITGIFVFCWLPFFINAIIMPFCGDWCTNNVPDIVGHLVTWLGYSNSMLNPIIYTIFSLDFRKAFKRILCGG